MLENLELIDYTYKELCHALNENVKQGKSKQQQLKRWRLFFATCFHILYAEVNPQSAIMPRTLSGRFNPAVINTVVAPMDIPAKYAGSFSPYRRFTQ